MGISDYLERIEELTNTNLKLLKALNSAFYTDQNHLSVNMGDEGTFTIPSFITLENKINTLQDNFQNLVNSPTTSDAYFVFDGNSRAIQVKGYEQSPAPLSLPEQSNFYHENNNVFKDFLTPVPYLKFDTSSIPNDINSVIVRKITANSEVLKDRFSQILGTATSKNMNWGDISKMLDILVEGTDYIIYDTVQRLPFRTGQGTGSYIIKEIVDEEIDENLDQHITVTIQSGIPGYQDQLTYLLFDQTTERNLSIGDYLVSWNGTSKFEIENLNVNTNTIKLKVMYGEYSELIAYDGSDNILDECKLKYFSNSDLFQGEKYVKVPLEEDEFIYVSIAPLNDRMNIRSPWGAGILVHVDALTRLDVEEGEDSSFRTYYNNCRNIGDILNEISKVMSNTTSSHTNTELNDYMSAKPVIDTDIIQVIHINKHLDDTTTAQNIRALYSQKNSYNADLVETQNSITNLQNELASIDFQDVEGRRASVQNQIDELTAHKNDLINSLMKITNEIALTANNSVVPIEAAKYRIRGFFDYESFANNLAAASPYHNITPNNIKGIYVQYRYRSIEQETGTAHTFVKDTNNNGIEDSEDKTFVFSDWNELHCPLRPRIRMSDGTYGPYPDTSNKNLPSFNQIDIPITQGEYVDMRLMVVYDFGYPFIQMTSGWSDIVTFDFPEKFIKDVQILDIIKENNNDVETNRFKNLLDEYGVVKHVDDKLVDQDKTYFHKPENIASGFYTAERRVIPLKDKLQSMDNEVIALKDEVYGTTADQLAVNIDFDESSISLSPFERGKVILKEYSFFDGQAPGTYGNYVFGPGDSDNNYGVVSIYCNIRLSNPSSRTIKIYSMFPGSGDTAIKDLKTAKFTQDLYENIRIMYPSKSNRAVRGYEWKLQTTNQILTFTNENHYDGTKYYTDINDSHVNVNVNPLNMQNKIFGYVGSDIADNEYRYDLIRFIDMSADTGDLEIADITGMSVEPCLNSDAGLLMTYNEAYNYMLINPGDEIIIPLLVQYKLDPTGVDVDPTNYNPTDPAAENWLVKSIQKTISFDIRTSLYKDPMNYIVTFCAEYEANTQNKLISGLIKKYTPSVVKTKEYKTVVK